MNAVTSGPTPTPGRRDGRRVLHLAADPEQMGVVAGEPDDVAVVGAGDRDQEVAVRDAAAEGREDELAPGQLRDPLHGRDQLVAQLADQGCRRPSSRPPYPRPDEMRRDDRSPRRIALLPGTAWSADDGLAGGGIDLDVRPRGRGAATT